MKSKKNIKSPSKSGDQRRCLKRSASEIDHMHINTKRMRITQCKNKKEKKSDKDMKGKDTNSYDLEYVKVDESSCGDSKDFGKEITEDTVYVKANALDNNVNKTNLSNEIRNTVNLNINVNAEPWTRQEDMILLQTIKKEYSENSLGVVSKTLGNRTIDQVSSLMLFYIFRYNICM